MLPSSDTYADQISAAVGALLDRQHQTAEDAIAQIAYPRREVQRRPSPRRRKQCDVFWRDNFHCRYCGRKTVLSPVMELLAGFFPDDFPFESDHWRGGVTHPAFLECSPFIDHVEPGSQSGRWTDDNNLVTACNVCNTVKADFTLQTLGWDLLPIPPSSWDGLARSYRVLWVLAGEPEAQRHTGWMRDLGI